MTDVTSILRLWGVPRKTVYRWVGHPACALGKYRVQSNDDHRRELVLVLQTVLTAVRNRDMAPVLDEALLLSAVWCHDDGEDFLGDDVLHDLKSSARDVKEYHAFANVISSRVAEEVWAHLHRAFLLQFVRKYAHADMFPAAAHTIMRELAASHAEEAGVFEFLERIDYLLYAREQFGRYGNPHFLREVFPNQVEKLDGLVAEFPFLDGLLWPELRKIGEAVVQEYGPLSVV